MTTLQKLKSYAISGIENWGGITSPDYKEFEKHIVNTLNQSQKVLMVN